VEEAFDDNYVVPLGPNVDGFEEDLKRFVGEGREVVALSAGTAAIHLALIACGVKAIEDRMRVTGRKPKAIIPVALYGMPYNIERIMEIASRYDIPVIEDAAEEFGSRWKGRVLDITIG